MLSRLNRLLEGKPWYVWSLVSGGLMGMFRFAWELIETGSPGYALLAGVFAGLAFGLLFGPISAYLNRRERSDANLGHMDANQTNNVRKAVLRGPVPKDEETRQAAIRLARYYVKTTRKQRKYHPVIWSAFTALSVFMVVAESLAHLWLTAVFVAFLVATLWLPMHYQRRLALLEGEEDQRGAQQPL